MISYPAIFEYDEEDGVYNVRFPDLPGCYTYGYTVDEAKENAQEALSAFLESIDSRRLKVPEPSKHKGDNVYLVEPDTRVGFAIWLKKQRESLGLSQSDIAEQLGIAYQTYQRIEDPARSNPTLTTILKLEKVFHKRLVSVD